MSVEVIINEVTTDEYDIELITVNPDILPFVERAETAADSAEDARDTAVQSAADALLSEQAAALSEGNALASEQAAALSEGNAQGYATSAGNSASAASTSASNALISENNAAQSASDAADALLQIGGFYDLEDAPGYDAGSAGQSLTNVGGVLTWQ